MTTDAGSPGSGARPTPLTGRGWLGVWALWLVLTAVGGLAGLGLAAYVESTAVFSNWLSWKSRRVSPWLPSVPVWVWASGCCSGAGYTKPWSWIVPTVAGQSLGWFAAVAVSWHYDAWVLTWVVSGIGQWLVLRRWVHRSWWWLIAAVSYAPLRWLLDWTGVGDVEVWGGVLIYGTPVALAGLVLVLLFARSAKPGQLKSRTGTARPVFLRYLTTPPKPAILRYLWVMLMVVFGLAPSAALLAVGLFLLLGVLIGGFGGGGCSEHYLVEITSPDGRYVARSGFRSCGGATGGGGDWVLAIRDVAGPYLKDSESGVVAGREYPWVLGIKWHDARTLVFDSVYRTKQRSEGSSSACKDWRDIRVVCPATATVPDSKSFIEPTPVRTERGVTTIPSRAVRFTETFETPEAGKLPATSPEPGRFYAGYEDGEYVVRLTKPAKGTLARIGLPGIHTDVELSVDARLVKGIDDAVIVLGCRVNPDYGEEYRLRIDPSRARFTLDQWIDGEATDTYWYYHGVIPEHWTNRIRLYCGRELNVYLNDEWGLSARPDPPPGAGRMTFSAEGGVWIGVEVVSASATNVEARFDNLSVASRAVR